MKSLELKRIARMSLAATGLLIGLALTPVSVTAQEMSPEQACKDDAFRLCDQFIPDRDKVGACLRQKARSLSPACRTFVVGGGRQHYTGRGRTHVRTRTHHHYTHHPRHHK